jgi:hypothetical protein
VVGPEVAVSWSSQDVEIRDADGSHTPGVAHYHLILLEGEDAPLDLPPGQPIGRSETMVHTTQTAHTFSGLSPGAYTLYLVLGDGLHVPLDPPVTEVVHFQVVTLAFLEPADRATIWGDNVYARWVAEGIGDSQHTHLVLIPRRDARLNLPAGEPIPSGPNRVHADDTQHRFENLLPGPYTLYLVLGDGQGVPADPPVARAVHFELVPVEAGSGVQDTPWWLIGLVVAGILAAAYLLQQG